MKETILYRVSCSLSKKGWDESLIEWKAIEKEKVYVITRDNGGELITRHIKKNEIGAINSAIHDIAHINFWALCFEGEVDSLKIRLKEKVAKAAIGMRDAVTLLVNHIVILLL